MDGKENGGSVFTDHQGVVAANGDHVVQAESYPVLVDKKVAQRELRRGRSGLNIAKPWLIWPVLVISIVVGGMSGPVTVALIMAAPISCAGWRHQVSALVMLPFFIFQWRKLQKCDRSKACSIQSLGLFFLSGLFLSGECGFYLLALNHTSMIHALVLCCMSPIFVAIYTKITGGVLMTKEILGVGLGVLGVGLLAAGTKVEKDNQSSYLGDFIALFSSLSMAGYFAVGKKLRRWMPLFVYQFPVAFIAAIILGAVGLLLEGWNNNVDDGNISGPFGWFRKEYFLQTVFLGIGPGVVGHAGYNFVLRYLSPLVVPTGISLQPIIGSTIGWLVGESPIPGIMTVLGAAVTLQGTLLVSFASAEKMSENVETKEEEYKQPATDDEEGQRGTKPLLQPSDLP
ncbi:unnamed protein product [Calypogeia fissa]